MFIAHISGKLDATHSVKFNSVISRMTLPAPRKQRRMARREIDEAEM
jgi:hypothetical protein